jgi:hypothetical protein
MSVASRSINRLGDPTTDLRQIFEQIPWRGLGNKIMYNNSICTMYEPRPPTPQVLGVPMLEPEFQSDPFCKNKGNDNPLMYTAQWWFFITTFFIEQSVTFRDYNWISQGIHTERWSSANITVSTLFNNMYESQNLYFVHKTVCICFGIITKTGFLVQKYS